MSFQVFEDRTDAGRRLAEKLLSYHGRPEVVILGLPRGGVPIAFEIAKALNAPLDILLVRKLGVPFHPELAMGAIATGGYSYLDNQLISQLGLSKESLEAVVVAEARELRRREEIYRMDRPPLNLREKIVILVDDGLATGSSMVAAIRAVRSQNPKEIVIAVPVAAADAKCKIESSVEHFISVIVPEYFSSVGQWYETFNQTTDEEVCNLLREASHPPLKKVNEA